MARPQPPGGTDRVRPAAGARRRRLRGPRDPGRLLTAGIVLILVAALAPRALADAGDGLAPLTESFAEQGPHLTEPAQDVTEQAPGLAERANEAPAGFEAARSHETGGGAVTTDPPVPADLPRETELRVAAEPGHRADEAAAPGEADALPLDRLGGPGGCAAGGGDCAGVPVPPGGPLAGAVGDPGGPMDIERRFRQVERILEEPASLDKTPEVTLETLKQQIKTLQGEVTEPDRLTLLEEAGRQVQAALDKQRGASSSMQAVEAPAAVTGTPAASGEEHQVAGTPPSGEAVQRVGPPSFDATARPAGPAPYTAEGSVAGVSPTAAAGVLGLGTAGVLTYLLVKAVRGGGAFALCNVPCLAASLLLP
jgi:hypothetical protein